MKVIVMYRNNWFGGDGWTFYPKTIEISDNCPICGEPRGKPYGYNFYEDGESFYVNKWDNPCGHIDYYKDVLIEADKMLPSNCKGGIKMDMEKKIKELEKRIEELEKNPPYNIPPTRVIGKPLDGEWMPTVLE